MKNWLHYVTASVALLVANVASALTVTGPTGGATATLGAGGVITWSYTLSGPTNHGHAGSQCTGVLLAQTTGSGGSEGTPIFDLTDYDTAHSSSGTTTQGNGQWMMLAWVAYQVETEGGPFVIQGYYAFQYFQVTVKYKIDVPIPANAGDGHGNPNTIYYELSQDGSVISTFTTHAGDPAQTVHLVDLDTDDPITVQAYRQQVNYVDNGSGGYTPTFTNTPLGPATTGTPTLDGATTNPAPGPSAASPVVKQPVIPPPMPSAQPPPYSPSDYGTAPTANTPVTGNTPTPPPFGDTSGTDGATTGDIATAANGIVAAVNANSAQNVDLTNKMIHVIDGMNTYVGGQVSIVGASVDKVGAAVTDGSGKIVNAVDRTTTEVNSQGNNIVKAIGNLQDQLANQQAAGDGGAAGVQGGSQAAGSAAQGTASSGFQSAVGNIKTLDGTGTSSASVFALTIPGIHGSSGTAINLDPTGHLLGTVGAWVKALIALVVAWKFTFFAISEVQLVLLHAGILGPARGNTVAGSGGQITSTLVATWTTVVMLAAPTALMAIFTDMPTLFGSGGVSIFGALPSDSGIGGGVLLFMDTFFPTATVLSAAISYLLVKKASTAIYLGISAAIRWFIA